MDGRNFKWFKSNDGQDQEFFISYNPDSATISHFEDGHYVGSFTISLELLTILTLRMELLGDELRPEAWDNLPPK